uniref:Uncharacterized protein n=1 Tax=Oryzias latipes TaxID=8090 RepID=A0A3P9L4Q2_ORYLA
ELWVPISKKTQRFVSRSFESRKYLDPIYFLNGKKNHKNIIVLYKGQKNCFTKNTDWLLTALLSRAMQWAQAYLLSHPISPLYDQFIEKFKLEDPDAENPEGRGR